MACGGSRSAMLMAMSSPSLRSAMSKAISFGLLLSAVWFATAAGRAQTAGDVFPKWTAGTLDIHHINTGLGNAAFLMFPDGTTMLIDAGNGGNLPPRGTPPKPDASF